MSASCSVVPSKNDCCNIYTGKGVPSSTLGVDGSIFVSETSPYILYKKVNGNWVVIGSLKGADGTGGSENIIYSVISQTLTGSQTDGSLFNYSIPTTILQSSGEFVKVIGNIYLFNESTITDPIKIDFLYDNKSIGSYSYAPLYSSWVNLDLKISRISDTAVFFEMALSESYGSTTVGVNGLSFEGTPIQRVYNGTITTTFTTAKDIDIKVTQTDGTVILYKAQVLQYKLD